MSAFSYTPQVYFEVGKIVHRIKIHQGKVASLKVDAIVSPLVVKLTAVASIMVWFTVAATGRWIGFS